MGAVPSLRSSYPAGLSQRRNSSEMASMGRLMAVHALLKFGRHSIFTWMESSRLLRANESIHRLRDKGLFLFLGKVGGGGWGEHTLASLPLKVSDGV
jgi:hypothetical protein